MADLGKAYVQVVPSAKGLKGSLTKAMGGEASSAGTAAGNGIASNIKGVLAKAAIGATVVAGIKKSLSEGAKLEQSIGGIETLFKSSSDQMIKYADQAYKTAGLSANTYMEQATSFSASLLQSTGGDTQKAAKAANQAIIDMSDNANKMGTDIGSIQNAYQGFAKQNYTMLDNLKLGYGGTKTEMERLLKDAGKISGQKYDISNLNDVYEAIHVIQGELDITGTTSKEAASTLSGSAASMSAAFDNFMGNLALGRNVGPSMKALAETAGNFFFNNLIPAIGRIIMSLPEAIGALISTAVPAIMQQGKKLVDGLMSGVNNGLVTKAATLVGKGALMFRSIVLGFLSKLPSIVGMIGKMIDKFSKTLQANLPTILSQGRTFIVNFVTGIYQRIPAFINAIAKLIPKLVSLIQKNLPTIVQQGAKLIVGLVTGFLKNLPKILAATAKLGLAIVEGVLKLIPTLISAGFKLVGGIAKGIARNIGPAIKGALKGVVDFITSPFKKAIEAVKGFFSFKISWPKIPLPHFSVSPKGWKIGDLLKGKIPSLGIEWYRKAEDNPYMFKGATLFGAGEHNDEVLYGRSALMKDIEKAAGNNGNTYNFNVTVNGADDPEDWADKFARRLKMQTRMV